MIFLSHATPEDNEFTRWLALQLANEGYADWLLRLDRYLYGAAKHSQAGEVWVTSGDDGSSG